MYNRFPQWPVKKDSTALKFGSDKSIWGFNNEKVSLHVRQQQKKKKKNPVGIITLMDTFHTACGTSGTRDQCSEQTNTD